jgi:L-alanine-DL-glutamate epimerase-like enolase superfamily enzyme
VKRLEELTVYHLVLPLVRPYVLSFGAVERFDSFVALAAFDDGSHTLGETTPLPGYSHETADLITAEMHRLAGDGCLTTFLERNAANPFVTAPVLTCLEPGPVLAVGGTVPVCPILQWDNLADIDARVGRLAAAGAHVVKVKIGPDVPAAVHVIRATARAGRRYGMRFRYDANQSLDPAGARAVLDALDPAVTDLLEQPFPVHAWDAMAALHAHSPVPLMLDESVVDEHALLRAAACADVVKLKLAKNGSPARLLRLVEQARRLGLDVILGNGAQSTLGCVLEGKVQLAAGLGRPGEMNGFRKLRGDPLGFLVRDGGTTFDVPGAVPFDEIRRRLEDGCVTAYRVPRPRLPTLHTPDAAVPRTLPA